MSEHIVVKPLEWEAVALVDGWNWLTVARAETPFGRYTLDKHDKGFLRIMFGNKSVGHFEDGNREEAKAAAQADYSARILSAIAAPPAEGFVTVPVEPPEALLKSMAIRYDHGLGVPGYYDKPIFGAENVGHARRLESTMTTMRQLYEEVVGKGFYRANH
ncbi:hypothetical protein HJB80_02955 [Rhizobium lentis]|uniref:hypothetical protein n=1 Tax=Rhizobium lentis TaxID=1138194 RepID=UPI001C828510|nr:hypothetical protein [Rhizobium lentis]MBX5131652.1 hypothetical protein [Rhizobium lentis]